MEADVIALAYGLPDKDTGIPPALRDACRRARLTLLSVRYDVPFIAVSKAFVERLTLEREADLHSSVRRVEDLVEAVSSRRGLSGILDILARDTKLATWVLGMGRDVKAAVPSPPSSSDIASALASIDEGHTPFGAAAGWVVFPIQSNGGPEALLAVERRADTLGLEDRAVIEQVLPFLRMELDQQRALRETEERFASELIDLIRAGPTQVQAASARLEAFGLDPDGTLAAIVCDSTVQEVSAEVIEGALARADIGAVLAVNEGLLVAIVQPLRPEANLVPLVSTVCDELGRGTFVGIGRSVVGVDSVRASLVAAEHACRVARAYRPDAGYATQDDLGSHTLLLALQDQDLLDTFRRTLLGPVQEHDARYRGDLLDTLNSFLSSGCRWKETASAMHVHVNTLRHRLARVERLTGRSLASMEDRVDFFIALRSRDLSR
jgi:hypothetical protein